MSVREGTCDYCGRDHLLETGDERSVINQRIGSTVKLWCGTCRAGSRDRFIGQTDEGLAAARDTLQRLLDEDPIRWDDKENPETIEERGRKLCLLDERYRVECELEFRANEVSS